MLGEATALGQKGGISRSELIDLLTSTLFGAPVVAGYGERIAAGAYQPAGFRMPLGLKDIELALAAGLVLSPRAPSCAITCSRRLPGVATTGTGRASPPSPTSRRG